MSKQKDEQLTKGKYNALYIGWKECPGLYGTDLTDPIINEMLRSSSTSATASLPKVTISVTKKELKITQTITKKPGKTETVKFHQVPMKDVMFVSRGSNPSLPVVACVYVGYNPMTKAWVHVHLYQCESTQEADTLHKHLMQYLNTPYHRDRLGRIEREMVKKGQIQPITRPDAGIYIMGFPAMTNGEASEPVYGTAGEISGTEMMGTNMHETDENQSYQKYLMGGGVQIPRPLGLHRQDGSRIQPPYNAQASDIPQGFTQPQMNPNQPKQPVLPPNPNPYRLVNPFQPPSEYGSSFDPSRDLPVDPPDYDQPDPRGAALAEELRTKLKGRAGPILLPPKDYDTVNRTKGSLIGIEARRCLNENIVGKGEYTDEQY